MEEVVLAVCGAPARLGARAPLWGSRCCSTTRAGTDDRFPESPDGWDAFIDVHL